MKKNLKVEAEGSELVLKNKVGDYVIIPKDKRASVQDMLSRNCNSCIDSLVETLPTMANYAVDGTVMPSEDPVPKPKTNAQQMGITRQFGVTDAEGKKSTRTKPNVPVSNPEGLANAAESTMKTFSIGNALMAEAYAGLTGQNYDFRNTIDVTPTSKGGKQRSLSQTTGTSGVTGFALDMLDPGLAAGLVTGGVKAGMKGLGKFAAKNAAEELPKITDNVAKKLTSSKPLVSEVSNEPWKLKELPGLHLQSTMEQGAVSKIVDKTGKVNTEQAFAIIAKESGGADKVEIIKKGFGENIPAKMDYNDFRKTVQDQLIPLEKQMANHKSDYGISRLGYNETTTGTWDVIPSTAPLENQTIILSNKSKFGRGAKVHGNPDETLGHVHFLRDTETPDVLTVTQIQSDAFQGPHKIIPKTQEEALQKVNKLKEDMDEVKDIFNDNTKASQSVLDNYNRNLQLDEASVKNFTQKQLLEKNHQERYLQELVDYAGKRGDVNKVRLPTSETAAKVQGYEPKKTWNINGIENGDEIVLTDGTIGKVTNDTFINNITVTTKDGKKITIDMSDAGYGNSKTSPVKSVNNVEVKEISTFSPENQTILKKYADQPKTVKKLFGTEPQIVTDSKGNTWYEFDIPEKFKKGKGEIKALTTVGITAGTAAAALQKSKNKKDKA